MIKRKRLKGSREPAVHSPAVAVLPNPLRSNVPVEKEWTDDPAKHGGRVRYTYSLTLILFLIND